MDFLNFLNPPALPRSPTVRKSTILVRNPAHGQPQACLGRGRLPHLGEWGEGSQRPQVAKLMILIRKLSPKRSNVEKLRVIF